MIIKLLFLILTLAATSSQAQSDLDSYECRIYSDLYKQYLYAKYKFLGIGSRRTLHYWKDNMYSFFYRHPPKTSFDEKDPSGVWLFERVLPGKNEFYIRNRKYNDEYMRGSESFQELIFKKNRAVYVEKKKLMDDDDSFKWMLTRVPNTHLYQIWNVKYKLPMYTREYHTVRKDSNNIRHNEVTLVAGLWNDNPYSEQFEWLLRCRDGQLPELYT